MVFSIVKERRNYEISRSSQNGLLPDTAYGRSLITGILVRNGPGKIRIFDPCAGEGHALKEIKDSLQCESYEIEPDTHRGKIAKQNLTRCLITDYENSRISNRAFSLLYPNLISVQ